MRAEDAIRLGTGLAARGFNIFATGQTKARISSSLRKMLEAAPRVKPIDRLIVLGTPRKDQSEGQRRMALGLDTVLAEVLPRLRGLGVEIEKR